MSRARSSPTFFSQRLEEASEHVVVSGDHLQQLRRVFDVEEDRAEALLLVHGLDEARGEELKEDARDFELGEIGASGELADVGAAVEVVVDRDLGVAHVELTEVGDDALHACEHELEARHFFADPRRLVEAANTFHDHTRCVDLQNDPLLRQLLGGIEERELAILPADERVDDLQDLILHAPPEILRRERAHLHEDLAVAQQRRHAPLRLLVLLLIDLAVAQEKLPEGVLVRARAGEHDLALFPMDRPLQIRAAHDELPALANHRHETEDIRKLDLGKVALKDWFLGHGPDRTQQ